MIKIRLTRCGAKKRPCYRFVVADAKAPRDGRFIDSMGSYAPTLPDDSPRRLIVDLAKVEKWLKIGAQPTDRVVKLLAVAKKQAAAK